jgi:hypothetical protein
MVLTLAKRARPEPATFVCVCVGGMCGVVGDVQKEKETAKNKEEEEREQRKKNEKKSFEKK